MKFVTFRNPWMTRSTGSISSLVRISSVLRRQEANTDWRALPKASLANKH